MIALIERELGVLLGYGFAALLAWSTPPANDVDVSARSEQGR